MFANKGDSASTYLRANAAANASLKDITDVKRLIQADYDILKKNISNQLGKSSTQGFGETGKAREFPSRWDYQGTAFLLTERPGEYCVLRVLPSSSADQGGKTSRISDSGMRERMKNNVVHRSNGDVIIENIPMVDQGPKGFCVPATYTRVLLYAGVPADLYLLALLGRTDVGGGTSTIAMENSARALAASYGRSITSVSPSLDLPKLETFFEKGIPSHGPWLSMKSSIATYRPDYANGPSPSPTLGSKPLPKNEKLLDRSKESEQWPRLPTDWLESQNRRTRHLRLLGT